jgi:hypothetical protein
MMAVNPVFCHPGDWTSCTPRWSWAAARREDSLLLLRVGSCSPCVRFGERSGLTPSAGGSRGAEERLIEEMVPRRNQTGADSAAQAEPAPASQKASIRRTSPGKVRRGGVDFGLARPEGRYIQFSQIEWPEVLRRYGLKQGAERQMRTPRHRSGRGAGACFRGSRLVRFGRLGKILGARLLGRI